MLNTFIILGKLDLMEPQTTWQELGHSLLIEIPENNRINENGIYPGNKKKEKIIKNFSAGNNLLNHSSVNM